MTKEEIIARINELVGMAIADPEIIPSHSSLEEAYQYGWDDALNTLLKDLEDE